MHKTFVFKFIVKWFLITRAYTQFLIKYNIFVFYVFTFTISFRKFATDAIARWKSLYLNYSIPAFKYNKIAKQRMAVGTLIEQVFYQEYKNTFHYYCEILKQF